jgi:hypothetical protein
VCLILFAKCNCTVPLYKAGIPSVECLSALLHKVTLMETKLLGRWSEVSGGAIGVGRWWEKVKMLTALSLI